MRNAWIVEVLKDIRDFAKNNGMLDLSEHLDDAIFLALFSVKEKNAEKNLISNICSKQIKFSITEKDE